MAALNHEKEGGHNYLNWHAGWNWCQESLNHRNLKIWLKGYSVIKGKVDGQSTRILLNTDNQKFRVAKQKAGVNCAKGKPQPFAWCPELCQFSDLDSIN